MGEALRKSRLARSSAASASRILDDRAAVAKALADRDTRRAILQVAKPNSPSKSLRKAGVALLLSPDPFTTVSGAVLLGASVAARGKDPLSASEVSAEAKKLLSDLRSIRDIATNR